ncbi:YciI-like protein [Steroidobacter sp.]|uniref:YciI-like protein n=1 Tax=Steroidobacter sp. TaxID=1978227 RepID=UPI001A5B57F4|nr:YciI-like protein [Steroidobacter sp.]MBL8268652.1 YciI family protein [Steroidobacter sp.]
MKHFLMFYETSADYVEKRVQFRDAHLQKAWASVARNEMILGGALADPTDGAVILFRAESREVVENFAKSDPYVQNGLVTHWYIREWNTVVGETAMNPVRPASA